MAGRQVDHYLLAFDEALVAGTARREQILAEVEGHLRDSVAAAVARGLAAEAAEAEAVAHFGDPVEAAGRFGPDPLGRAQRLSRWYDGWRVLHPWRAVVVFVVPWTTYVWVTSQDKRVALVNGLLLFSLMVSHTLLMRRRTEPSWRARRNGLLRDRRRLVSRVMWPQLAVYAVAVAVLWSPPAWLLATCAYYALCATAANAGRPSARGGRKRTARWLAHHPSAAAVARYTGWGLALGGPALAALTPVTAGRPLELLVAAALFAAFVPLPSARVRGWLCERRPAVVIPLRAAPLLVLAALATGADPSAWPALLYVGGCVALWAASCEFWSSQHRAERARRRLEARVRDAGAA